MQVISVDNKGDNTIKNILEKKIKSGSKVAIASAYFSLFAFDAIKKQLDRVEDFKFLYTEPTFYKKEKDIKRQYHLQKENSVQHPTFDGNTYEIQLRNDMSSSRIAELAANWIQEKAVFKTIIDETTFPKEILIQNKEQGDNVQIQSEVEFTADSLGITESNRAASTPVMLGIPGLVEQSMAEFERIWNDEEKVKDVTEEVLTQIRLIYKENSPEWIYYVTLYNLFSNELDGIHEENIIREGTGFQDTVIWNKLYPFQRDGVLGIIDKIEKYNGCILADSVGLGKTFSALAVIKYYELRMDRVLVLAPKKLRDNWTVYTQNDKRNILSSDRFNYDVLNHTDLSRESGYSGEIRLDTINWGNYDLVVIDESHNFRNNNPRKGHVTRYQKLMQDLIQSGVKTKVLLLSATPVNNKMNDIKNQIAFITEDNDHALEKHGIDSIDTTLRLAQTAFNRWTELPASRRTTAEFMNAVNPDYFKLLDLLSIARSRKHIEKYYDTKDIGQFPVRLKPKSIKSDIDKKNQFYSMDEINDYIEALTFGIYQPMKYVLASKRKHYEELYDTKVKDGTSIFKQTDREFAVAALMKVNIFKRLESSIYSFNATLKRLMERMESLITILKTKDQGDYQGFTQEDLLETDDNQLESMTVGSDKVRINLTDIDHVKWLDDLQHDFRILTEITDRSFSINAQEDAKLADLLELIINKTKHPINEDNHKVIVFSAFADTANYLYEELAPILSEMGLHSALVVGSGSNKTTLKGVRTKDINDILLHFSPRSKEREKVESTITDEIDILFATDCISEGQNLQDCDYLVNYDIHWNPVRVIQRFGRIDRIGSTNAEIQLVNFWPKLDLDEYINLEERVKGRMKLLNTSATGEEDIFENDQEMNDLTYRRNQLKVLQEEVVNLEDISGAISITDLTFTEFKSDLTSALKRNESALKQAPKGMYAITDNDGLDEAKPGVIFCFRQVMNIEMKKNGIAPYILLYLTDDGELHLHYTYAKQILDIFRKLSLGKKEPLQNLVAQFNEETSNGENMQHYTELLKQSFDIVQDKQEEDTFDSFFSPGGTSVQMNMDIALNELELISFLIVKGAE